MTRLSRPLIKYFGSKWQLSKSYPKPLYDTIIEPFAGSACYASHYPEREIILYDKDPELIKLWKWLIEVDPEEIKHLPVTTLKEGQDLRELGLSEMAIMLISRWQRTGYTTCKTVSSWNNKPGMWQESVKTAILESLPRIRHWKAICLDYSKIPNRKATWFCDPPYQHVSGYTYSNKFINYKELGIWCKNRIGQTIVCEQQGADWLQFTKFRDIVAKQAMIKQNEVKKRKVSHEVMWTSN